MSEPIRVVLADDHTMVREALARILDESGSVSVMAQAVDGTETVRIVQAAPEVDVVVLDYSMPGLDGTQIIEKLQRDRPELRLLVLTVHENIHYAVRVIESGAHGYMIKSAAVEELVDAIHRVHDGELYLSPKIASQVLQHMRQPKRERIGIEALTPREFDLLRLIAGGASLQDSAEQMRITTSTASTYRSRILHKLNLKSTADIIRFAFENDIRA